MCQRTSHAPPAMCMRSGIRILRSTQSSQKRSRFISRKRSPRSIRRTPAFYDANYKKFEATINAKLQEWGTKLLPFKGQSVVAYHDSWVYFAHRFGLNIDIFLEPKPGIPPSPSHLAEVIQQMKAQHIKAILVEPYHNRKIAEKVAESTGAKVVDFAQFPGALPDTDTYVKLMDVLVDRLAAALK